MLFYNIGTKIILLYFILMIVYGRMGHTHYNHLGIDNKYIIYGYGIYKSPSN